MIVCTHFLSVTIVPNDLAVAPTPNTSNHQFYTLLVFDIHPTAQPLRQTDIPSTDPRAWGSDLAILAERLESLVLSQPEVLLDLFPSLFTRAVEIAMRGYPDWILSKAKATPGYLSSVAFLNHRLLHFWQISDLFHFLAGSPGLLPAVYRTVVDDLLSLQEGVGQPGRNVQSLIQNLAETGAGEAPPSAGVPQRDFEEAMQA
jgi:hypothetical protein